MPLTDGPFKEVNNQREVQRTEDVLCLLGRGQSKGGRLIMSTGMIYLVLELPSHS